MSNVVYLSVKEDVHPHTYWDQAFLDDLFEGLPDSDRTIVVIPGAYQYDVIDEINAMLGKYPKVLVFVTSDEEGKFDCEKLEHPDMIHYRQYGYCENLFPIGYTSETRKHLKKIGPLKKDINYFYAGQLNTEKRRRVFSEVALQPQSVLFGTDGFSKGLKPEEYYDYMAHAKYVPTPGGHVSPDSFRFYEALEAGAVPKYVPDYLFRLFPDLPAQDNKVFPWWIGKKAKLRQQLMKDLGVQDVLSVVIPTSPIPSHPSTEIISKTIESVRFHTGAPIYVTIDGLRNEQQDRASEYDEYVRRLLWQCNFEYDNVIPLVFDTHVHQSGMMKEVLSQITTPLIMYVEHDTPLVTDRPIDWEYLTRVLMRGDARSIRFHYEETIPEPHEHLMIPDKDMPYLLATRQWSQRPHLSRTDFYKDAMRFFSDEANCFIEDFLYGVCVGADWDAWKLFIYSPVDELGFKRSLNLDGRADDVKYDDRQIW